MGWKVRQSSEWVCPETSKVRQCSVSSSSWTLPHLLYSFSFSCCSRIERRRWRGRYIVVYLGRRPLSLLNDVSLQRQRPCDAVELEEEAASIAQGKTLGVLPPQRSGGGCAVGAFYIRIG